MSAARILLVDDDRNFRRVTTANLEKAGYAVAAASDVEDALRQLAAGPADLVISDIRMPGKDGLELFRIVQDRHPGLPVILITAHATVAAAVEAIKNGAADYLTKPFAREDLQRAVHRALELKRLSDENRELKSALARGGTTLVGGSAALKRSVDQLIQAAASDLTILIVGESGTGKELAARLVHEHSRRREGPFVAVNCSAFPHDLLESELFGHRRGAFTGAVRDHEGRFERARGGTLFLDEIGDLPLPLQPKLLRALEEGEVDPLGSTSPVKVDVRLVAATHRNLSAMVDGGAFRRDLYYRVNVVPVALPPLRDRTEDIPQLVRHLAARHGRPDLVLDSDVVARLASHSWPGNVRELDNLVARWAVVAGRRTVTTADLPDEILHGPVTTSGALPALKEQERALVERALEESGNNQSRAAARLGIPRHVLIYRMKKFGLGPYRPD